MNVCKGRQGRKRSRGERLWGEHSRGKHSRGNLCEGNVREGMFAKETFPRGTFMRECLRGATFSATICMCCRVCSVVVKKGPEVGPRWIDQNFFSNSLSGFCVFSYGCTTYRCLQFWFTEGLFIESERNFNEVIIRFWSIPCGPTLASHLQCSVPFPYFGVRWSHWQVHSGVQVIVLVQSP